MHVREPSMENSGAGVIIGIGGFGGCREGVSRRPDSGSKGGGSLNGRMPGFAPFAVRGALDAGGITVAVSPAMSLRDHSSGSHYGYPGDSTITILTGHGDQGPKCDTRTGARTPAYSWAGGWAL